MREKPKGSGCKRMGEGTVVSEMKRCAMGEFASVSEYVYYSIILENTQPVVARLFEEAATEAVERFRRLCRLIVSLGGDPALNMQIRRSREAMNCRDALTRERIEQILRSAEQSERRGVYALERALELFEAAELKREAERIAEEKKELAFKIGRILKS